MHGQDMALPLNRNLPVPPDAALNALQRAWSMGWPFHAGKRLAGYRLTATVTDWAAGDGPTIAGTTVTLLLLATGLTKTALPAGHRHRLRLNAAPRREAARRLRLDPEGSSATSSDSSTGITPACLVSALQPSRWRCRRVRVCR